MRTATILVFAVAACSVAHSQEPDYQAVAKAMHAELQTDVKLAENRLAIATKRRDRTAMRQLQAELKAVRTRAHDSQLKPLTLSWFALSVGAVGKPTDGNTPVRGTVLQADFDADRVLVKLDWAPDFEAKPGEPDVRLLAIHRDSQDWTNGERFIAPSLWLTDTVEYHSDGGLRTIYEARVLTAEQEKRVLAAASELQPASRAQRTWSDSTAAFKTDGVLERLDGLRVTIRKSDGTSIEIPLYKLSRADRSFVGRTLGAELD